MAGGSLGPFSRLIYYFQYHPRSACSRRIQEKLKGCKAVSESPREKEIKRKREREEQELLIQATFIGRIVSPRTCLCLRWIAHKWDKAAHLYQSLLSFRAWLPKCVYYNPCSILEDRFESLGMVPISSPMAWGGNQVKSYSIVSFRGKASSHGKGCSCVVLPSSAIVFLLRLRGEWVFFNPIFSFPMRL